MNRKQTILIMGMLFAWMLLFAPLSVLGSEMTVDVGIEFSEGQSNNAKDPPIKNLVTLPQTGETTNPIIFAIGSSILLGVTFVIGVRMKRRRT